MIMDIVKYARYIVNTKSIVLSVLCVVVCIIGMPSCRDGAHTEVCRSVDSLNTLAYHTRYQSLDTTLRYSQQAFDLSAEYTEGRAEAYLNLAFVQYMAMDYDSASTLYHHAYDLTTSMLTKAVADVGLMKICHVTGLNEAFYDYRSDAEQKLRRIADEDLTDLTPQQQRLLRYARSEFHMASSAYYNYIMQDSLGAAELKAVAADMSMLDHDPAQLARYYTLTGDLESAIEVSRRANLVYMQAVTMQRMSQNMINSSGESPDSISPFSLAMAQRALWLFRAYGSIYSRALTYLTISDYYLHANMPEVALDTATKALEFVNIQHSHVYGNEVEFLMPYSSYHDEESTEMRWMEQGYMNCAWEWIATIREHLSMIYSSMGMKRQSDYNRNIYLDILDATRQDRQLEHQVAMLEQERSSQNMLIVLVVMISVVLSLAFYFAIKHMKRKSEQSYDSDMKAVEDSFNKWMEDNERIYSSMEEEEKKIDSETYLHEQHIAENKRSYIDKSTSLALVYSIMPFLDRAVNELNKLSTANETAEVKAERVDYLRQLIDRICLYNDVLSHWIKIRQGIVSLNIENFPLQPLLDTLAKSEKTFTNKGLTLHLTPTDAVVKADRALTMFMINTLLDNARKYTPQGGHVGVNVDTTDQYVEISVFDTGRGLSAEDINTICNEKVYDSSRIGTSTASDGMQSQKGFGFGLMNCKSIIDKYRKTNAVFSVCMFNIESRVGQGSRFYFRLPRGVVRSVVTLITFMMTMWCSAAADASLVKASQYADSVYFANVDGLYDKALTYADSAIARLNDHYLATNPDGELLMSLRPQGQYTDILLWNSHFDTDYNIILDVRNEAAIAALALKQWNVYRYNNESYFRLYKLVTHDTSLAEISDSIRRANITRQTLIILAILLVVAGIMAFIIIYYRINLLPTFNMRQLMQFNRKLFAGNHPDIAQMVFEAIDDIRPIHSLSIGIRGDDGLLHDITVKTSRYRQSDIHASEVPDATVPATTTAMKALMAQVLASRQEITLQADRRMRFLPLTVPTDDEAVGVMAITLTDSTLSHADAELIRLITQHLATYIYYSNIRMEDRRNAIILKDDERQRALHEEQNIHVQNMVLDGSLSAIKHETMYYPSRIRQILSTAQQEHTDDTPLTPQQLTTLNELVSYYKDIYTLLAQCASRGVAAVPFKSHSFEVKLLAQYAERTMRKMSRRMDADIRLQVSAPDGLTMTADLHMMQYLIDNLLASALHTSADGQLTLTFSLTAEGAHSIVFTDSRDILTTERLGQLFYPDNLTYDEDSDRLDGIEYIICRQIVRLHDQYATRRGCRINAIKTNPGYKIEIVL